MDMKKTLLIFYACFVAQLSLSYAAKVDIQSKVKYLFTAEDGLSSTKITCITQDLKGYVWIGTEDGLNRYDGFNFVVYKNNYDDTLSIRSNYITDLFLDSRERVWIATTEGLSYYNSTIDGFINVSLGQPDHVLKYNSCAEIMEDSRGNLWFVSSGLGVVCYTPDTDSSRLITPADGLCSRNIESILEDTNGNIWLASNDKGLSIYNPQAKTFANYSAQNSPLTGNFISDMCLLSNGNILISVLRGGVVIYDSKSSRFISYVDIFDKTDTRSIFCVTESSEGDILLGTENSGVLIFDPAQRKLFPHPVFREDSEHIGDAKVRCIYEGFHNYLWFGLNYKGLFCLGHEESGFKSLRKVENYSNSLNNRAVTDITTDHDNKVWIATDGGGLNCYDPLTQRFTHYTNSLSDPTSISDNAVTSVFCDSRNNIWAGTLTGGICLLNRQTGTFTRYFVTPGGLPSNHVTDIQEDAGGRLWVGTYGGGLLSFNPATGDSKVYTRKEYPQLANDYLFRLFIDSHHRLWITTYYGLSFMNLDTEEFTLFGRDEGLSNISVFSVAEDAAGTIWVGTANGLNKYDDNTRRFSLSYPATKELSSTINAVVAHDDHLWMSTNHGIIRYLPERNEVKRYYYNSGLPANEFISGSYYKSPSGQIFFGGIDGLSFFYPEEIYNYDMTSKVYLTRLKINNNTVEIREKVDGETILNQSISETRKIRLKQSMKSITLDYVSMGVFDSYSVVYAYKLEGFDKDWVYVDYRDRNVTYTNLNPGRYTFRIKASSNPDIWGEETTDLVIEVLPAPWNSWWARTFYALMALLIAFLTLRAVYARIHEKNELRIQRIQLRQQEELNEIQNKFFTNISHEFRTPLTLITGPLERLITESDPDERRKTACLILRNTDRLQHLINQILDLNKLEDGKIHLHIQPIELVSFVSESISTFTELARQKNISLSYKWQPDRINIWYDADMLDKCLNNLLFNAYKFTPEGGKIHVEVKQDKEHISLTVADTGIGISAEDSSRIFDRFYQSESAQYNTGTGIGLHLTKSIVEMHHGTLSVNSKEHEGTTFTLTILPGMEHFAPEDIAAEVAAPDQADDTEETTKYRYHNDLQGMKLQTPPKAANPTHPLLLLVEDDYDMRYYIRQELENNYRIEEAVNGREGLAKAHELMPDIILTDVMMPEMNGIEFCRLLKTSDETSHIPVVILTAQADLQHRLVGLETGADSYITKPFNTDYLSARLSNLLETRRRLRERFEHTVDMDVAELNLTSNDERLIRNVTDYVHERIEDPDLSVETMSKDLGLSRTHLHRKLKALTGQTPIEFIKAVKMKRAAQLLATRKLTISEVAYKVGYNSPSYFSSSFTAYFGMSPTAYTESL
ncbi:signal transduction histidine kinase/ligand-binding sensor domain-containing protein/DNA-binding response OmpR family regulator [Parabacteroides sp. PF5-5]|uniref:hybrid sensor histidine kinase/response regulator transcription factor n=1 Tax=unclassified Parabacteroides TaxID=2649774 RepID=UPI0024756B79|nr:MULTISPECIES: hybrid sensor histidine kinase/response regulator transcription factor [unclassified Parabacteroides]MDH6304391.1 signal transduction histidine kinase/ligand-binding sensor domain-containing protein/DNA-binding response OmpR family regulator [Parabacteroides sp. PH5-39]MDH6315456.1 signal transduction histidine kinase/ligand-binding sensor domain-containing protein/DNA-binding response OmpR family regulator [Parabacteroides sp. PF5-13]MDH6319050.1 signal transduction histidine k